MQICNGFVRAGEVPRERFMLWWRGVLESNMERTKEYNQRPEMTCRCSRVSRVCSGQCGSWFVSCVVALATGSS